MSCKKHGYTNNTFCPACDLETLENAMPNSTNVNEERIAKAISGSLLIVWSGESDKVAEGIWSQHRLTAERVAVLRVDADWSSCYTLI